MSNDELTSNTPADPLKVRDFWLDVVRPAADAGKLDKIPARKARTPREKAQAKAQNYYLTRKTFGGYGDRYDLINWNRTSGACGCGDAA